MEKLTGGWFGKLIVYLRLSANLFGKLHQAKIHTMVRTIAVYWSSIEVFNDSIDIYIVIGRPVETKLYPGDLRGRDALSGLVFSAL